MAFRITSEYSDTKFPSNLPEISKRIFSKRSASSTRLIVVQGSSFDGGIYLVRGPLRGSSSLPPLRVFSVPSELKVADRVNYGRITTIFRWPAALEGSRVSVIGK